jgi:hypothetical protein
MAFVSAELWPVSSMRSKQLGSRFPAGHQIEVQEPISPQMNHALRIAESVMKPRHFDHQPLSRVAGTGPIAFAEEDDGQFETWMIGQG